MNTQETTKEKGFTLLYAVLVSILVIAVGASIISIALKQTILSNSSRDSQIAFYAANTGIECALYWDIQGVEGDRKGHVFPLYSADEDLATNTDDITCAGGNIVTGDGFASGQDFTDQWLQLNDSTTFYLALSNNVSPDINSRLYCVRVDVEKFQVDTNIETRITSRGYNTCDIDHPRAVERGLVMRY